MKYPGTPLLEEMPRLMFMLPWDLLGPSMSCKSMSWQILLAQTPHPVTLCTAPPSQTEVRRQLELWKSVGGARWIDIDSADIGNPMACTDYVDSIMDTLYHAEVDLLLIFACSCPS